MNANEKNYECEINVEEDGLCIVMGQDQDKITSVVEIIDSYNLIPTPGETYDATVVKIMEFGAFVRIAPGKEGLVHISEMRWERVNKVEDIYKEGDAVKVKLMEIDKMKRLNFTIKALMDKPAKEKS